jgi:hypothetical protein
MSCLMFTNKVNCDQASANGDNPARNCAAATLRAGTVMQARSVFQNRRHGVEECDRLSQQLQLYLVGSPPFDQPFTPQTSAKAWWLNLGSSHTSCTELLNLAVFMCSIVPHAASAERVSSIMGWYHTPVRSQLDMDSLARVVALKTHLQHHVPR